MTLPPLCGILTVEVFVGLCSEKRVVPVVFSTTDNYVPPLAVALRSILEHTDPARNEYRFFVLHEDVSAENAAILAGMVGEFPGCTLELIDVAPHLAGISFSNMNYSAAAFYRFLIPYTMQEYPAVIYLDCDIIACVDVAQLLDYDYGSFVLGAAHRIIDEERWAWVREYAKIIGLSRHQNYFNSGVLVYNTKNFRRLIGREEVLQMAAATLFDYPDQDLLNVLCEGRVLYFPMKWNALVDTDIPGLSFDDQVELEEARCRPAIIHMNGDKPWKPWRGIAGQWRTDLFWATAAKTPYGERLLKMLAENTEMENARDEVTVDENAEECIFSTGNYREIEQIEKHLKGHALPFKTQINDNPAPGEYAFNLYVPREAAEAALSLLTAEIPRGNL